MTKKSTLIIFILLLSLEKNFAQVSFTESPATLQLYPRQSNDSSQVNITGKVTSTGYNKAIFTMSKNGLLFDSATANLSYSGTTASFSRAYHIHAEKSFYQFKMYLYNGTSTEVFRADSVCSGDVFLVNGQSNAVALASVLVSDTSYIWVRSFGSKSPVSSECQADTLWGIANAGTGPHHCGIGVWAYRLGKIIADSTGIPVCIINGGKIGTRIIDHLPLVDHADINTVYGRIMFRTKKAKVTTAVKAIFWYQGESDADTSSFQYANRFQKLYYAWKQDYPSLSKIVVMQIRPGCMTGSSMIYHQQLRETERNLPSSYPDIILMTTAAIPDYDGCHFSINGYNQLAQRLYNEISDNFYNKPLITGSDPPKILKALYTNLTNTEISLIFDEPVVWPSPFNGYNLKDYIYLNSNVTILNGYSSGDTIKLQLSSSSNADKISYLPGIYYSSTTSIYQGPWLVNNLNIGVPSFYQFKISNPLIISGSLCSVDTIMLSTSRIGQAYQWYQNGQVISGANNSQFSATADGIYTLLMSDSNNVSVTSNPIKVTNGKIIPVITTSNGQFTYCVNGNVSLICDFPVSNFQWYRNGVSLLNANNSTYPASTNGSYTVSIQDANGCSSTSASVSVASTASPNASFVITNQFDVCQDSMTTLTANSGTGFTYQWQRNNINIPGATNQVLNTVNRGTYLVIVINNNGCSKASSAKSIPQVNPQATITASASSMCPGEIVPLTANSGSGYTYLWFKNNALISGANQQTYAVTVPASYGVRVTNSMGCSTNSAAKKITAKISCDNSKEQPPFIENDSSLLVYPNPFNSIITLQLLNNGSGSGFDFEILDAYMEKIKEVKNLSISPGNSIQINMDGLSDGIYYYHLANADHLYAGKIIKR